MKRFEEKENLILDNIDLTPMVNVSLIMVIIFMCIIPLSVINGIRAISSKNNGVSIGKVSKEDIVKIELYSNGDVKINDIFLTKGEKLVPYIKDAIMYSPVKEVMITAEDDNLVQDLVYVMDLAKQNGAEKVGISEYIRD